MDTSQFDQLSRRLGHTLDRRRAGGLMAGWLGAVPGLVALRPAAEASQVGAASKTEQKCRRDGANCKREGRPFCRDTFQMDAQKEQQCKRAVRSCCRLVGKCKSDTKVGRCFERKMPTPM